MQFKQDGISILVAMGTSLLVLSLAFATLNSISRSLDQASNIQRSTQLFFASESGAEAAFFHHNARGAGLSFVADNQNSQSLDHDSIQAETYWKLQGRTNTSDSNSETVGDATVVDILKEGQTLKVPLQWDSSANPATTPNNTGRSNRSYTEFLAVTFFKDLDDIPNSTAKTAFEQKYNFDNSAFSTLDDGFDFGTPDNAVLIDWSLTRKHSRLGVQTFIPTNNQDCAGFVRAGYVCDSDFTGNHTGITITTKDYLADFDGKVLPGSINTNLDNFWLCNDSTVIAGDNCSDYQMTIRPLLKFQDSIKEDRIPGIPYQLKLENGNSTVLSFPQSYYNVTSDVAQENFSQQISINVPEKASIGAFDYVIFD